MLLAAPGGPGYPGAMTQLLLLAACVGASLTETGAGADTNTVADSGDSADTADTAEGTDVDTGIELNGEWATERTAAPEFVATNRDGSARSRPDLIGHPTVIWFYPAAGTSG
ncbi:hypothetical protein LBMAG42_48420 [Deltaproteobacteria bacterium]|nr:hypothetical protein LBMAG42_48420 [Deltaproteobacteria bacterium]